MNNMQGYVQFDENGTRVQNDVYIQQYRREHNSLSRVKTNKAASPRETMTITM